MESIATGLDCGPDTRREMPVGSFPRETALGSLCATTLPGGSEEFQPANITFDLLPAARRSGRRMARQESAACGSVPAGETSI